MAMKKLQCQIPEDVFEDLRTLANATGMTYGNIVAQALDHHVPTTRRLLFEQVQREMAARTVA